LIREIPMSHITLAASAKAFEQLFILARDNFTFSKSDSGTFGPFTASYSVSLHLQNGTIQLLDDNTVEIKTVDIVWDTLTVGLCFDLPGFCIGGWCIIPDPWNGCLVSFPGFCIGGPICIGLDLSGLVSEINIIKASVVPKYFVDPGRLPGWSDLDAEFNGKPNKWRIFIDPVWVSVDPIDVPATIANVLKDKVKDAIDDMFPSWVPGWAKDLIWAAIGPILDLVVDLLGIVDSIEDFISDLLGTNFGLDALLETALADYFANKYPIFQFEDPYPILEAKPGLIPVKIPIRNLTTTINSKEMVVLGDVGA
jgi:hypothetical protein